MTDRDYKCLRDLLCNDRVPVSDIVDVLEQEGALWTDKVGRTAPSNDSETEQVIQELKTVFKYQQMLLGSPSERTDAVQYFERLDELGSYVNESNHPLLKASLGYDTNGKLSGPEKFAINKDLHPKERKSLLTIVAALCKEQGIDCYQRGAAKKLVTITETLGRPVSEGTIDKFLKEIRENLDIEKT